MIDGSGDGNGLRTIITRVGVWKKVAKVMVIEVEERFALESQMIKHMIKDDCADTTTPLWNVTANILAKVIEYCKRHVENEDKKDEDLRKFNEGFIKIDQVTPFDLLLSANHLNIKSLLYLSCKTVADMIKGKIPEEIKKSFNIKNDFNSEEEEKVLGRMHLRLSDPR